MAWVADNLSWLVPTAITILGVPAFLAIKYLHTFPSVVAVPVIPVIGAVIHLTSLAGEMATPVAPSQRRADSQEFGPFA